MPKPTSDRYKVFLDGLKKDELPAEETITEPSAKVPKKAKARAKKKPTARSTDGPKIPRTSSGPVAKSKNPDFEKATYYLPKTTTRKMRLHAVSHQVEMSDLVNAAVIEYLENYQPEDE